MTPSLSTSYGRRRPHPPEPPRLVLLGADELRILCRQLRLDAQLAHAAGDVARADHLACRAASLQALEASP